MFLLFLHSSLGTLCSTQVITHFHHTVKHLSYVLQTPTPSYTRTALPSYNLLCAQTSPTRHRIKPMRSGGPPKRAAAKPLVPLYIDLQPSGTCDSSFSFFSTLLARHCAPPNPTHQRSTEIVRSVNNWHHGRDQDGPGAFSDPPGLEWGAGFHQR